MSRRKTNRNPYNIEFIFKNASVNCGLNPERFSSDDSKKAYEILSKISVEMHIDRTYVDGSRFENVFMTENGWKALCELVAETEYGRKANYEQKQIMSEAYRKMIACYTELFFKSLGWDVENMIFSVRENTPFEVEYAHGTNEYKTYMGKWQKWKKTENPRKR